MPLEDRELRTSGSVPPPSPGNVDMGSAAIAALPEDALILIPTRNLVLFPGTVLPITLGRQRSVLAAQTAMRLNWTVGLVLQRDPGIDDPIAVDLHRMGTEASLLRYVTSPDGGHHAICQGERRFRVLDFLDGYPFLAARVERGLFALHELAGEPGLAVRYLGEDALARFGRPEDLFLNLNTPEDWERYGRSWRRKS